MTEGLRVDNRRLKLRTMGWLLALLAPSIFTNAAPSLNISQTPLTVVIPNRPEVLIAIGNSESMDGTLSGAIMTGSGILPSSSASLYNSSSPTTYLVPSGFTPPIQGAFLGLAPYTVSRNNILYDNSASRLNVAKAGVQAIIENYLATTDFALEIYTTNTTVYDTWVYYLSPPSGAFTFTNIPILGGRYVTNPCFNYFFATSTVRSNCASLASQYGSINLSSNQFMGISASSDDPDINDVLYTNFNIPAVFITYNGPNPSSPYPPSFSLANYNNASISLSYRNTLPSIGAFATSPTNAGYVPFTPQVMYVQRGFGYGGAQSATSGSILVPMTALSVNPSTTVLNNTKALFTPFLNPETNQKNTPEIEAAAGQSPIAGLLTRALSYLSGLADSGGCPSKKYIVLISDGLPTQALNGTLWPPLGSAAAIGYNMTASFNADGSLNSTNDVALSDAITVLTSLKQAGIKTFIIGLGAGVTPSVNSQAAKTLTAMAVAGGTTAYYPATSPEDLVDDLTAILISVQNSSLSTTAAAVSSQQLQAGPVEYQASFTSSDSPYQDWTGNLVATSLDISSGLPTGSDLWSAQSLLDSRVSGTGWLNNRVMATWNPTLQSGAGQGVPFTWTSLSTAQKLQLQPTDLFGTLRLQYLRGNTAMERRQGGLFRNRSHILGDIVDSQTLYVGAPNGPYYYNSSYNSFIANQATRSPTLYVGANDGLLHAFSAETGAERFAFIPNGVFGNLANLTSTSYNQNHLFFVNGSPQAGDVQFSNGSWHTLLVGGENGGGKSIYALDITNPNMTSESDLAAAVLWEYMENDLGLTYSSPQIGPINPGSTSIQSFAVFFGNGYNSTNNKSVFYALNAQTGALIRKIDLCAAVSGACNANLPQGLSTVALGNKNGVQGQAITDVYAGDLQGNLWAIDVSSSNAAQWSARVLFRARDSSGNIQSITTEPVLSLHPLYPRLQGLVAMFGTGQLLTVADLNTTQTQTVYGVWDKIGSSTTYTRSNLQPQYLSLITVATSGFLRDILTNTNYAVNWGNNAGWYDDLIISGQRVVTEPQLLSGSFLTTLITPPNPSVCDGTFSSMLLELNYQTGGAFYRPQLDINGDGLINEADKYNGAYAVGVGLLPGYASTPTILGPDRNNNMIKLFTHASGQNNAVINPNNNPKMSSWWQIQ